MRAVFIEQAVSILSNNNETLEERHILTDVNFNSAIPVEKESSNVQKTYPSVPSVYNITGNVLIPRGLLEVL